MPTENKPVEPKLDYNTPDAGRSYIAELFGKGKGDRFIF